MKSLASQMGSRLGSLEESAVAVMAEELEFIRAHKDLLDTLLSFEGKWDATQQIEASMNTPMELRSISTVALTSENAYAFECVCTSYEPEKFDGLLAAADYANYFSGLRAHYGRGLTYGGREEWIVWYAASGRLLKVRFLGHLSALHQTIPDDVTHQLMVDAGIDVSGAIRPLFVLRASALLRRSPSDGVLQRERE